MGWFDNIYLNEDERAKALENAQREMALRDSMAQKSAQSRLIGGPDPISADPSINWSPDQAPSPNVNLLAGNGQQLTMPRNLQTPGGNVNLLAGPQGAPQSDSQSILDDANGQPRDFAQSQGNLLKQANPQAYMNMATSRALVAPLLGGMSDEQQRAYMLDPKAAGEANAKAAFPQIPDALRIIQGAQDQLAQMPKDDPRRGPLENLIQKSTTDEWQTPTGQAKIIAQTQEALAAAGKDNAETGLAGARQKQIEAGNISDEDINDMATRYIPTNDKTLLTTLGRGTQGSANIARFQAAVNRQMHASGASQRDIEMAGKQIQSAGATLTEFDKGKAGTDIRRLNAIGEHLTLVEELGKALDTGDVQAANAIRNKLSNEFGGVDINNYETAAGPVADEINKFAVGGPGAKEDREKAAASLSSSKSGPQRQGSIDTLKRLAASQLRGYQRQYEAGTGLKDFATRLSPEVGQLLTDPRYQSGGTPSAPGAPQAPLPPGMTKQIGTYKGRPVYLDAQGQRHVDTGP